MFRFIIQAMATAMLFSTPNFASAMNLTEAQACIDQLLHSYQTRTYPTKLIDEQAVISKSLGAAGRIMTRSDKAYATQRAKTIIREAFTNPTGNYTYKRVMAESIEESKNYGYRVTGKLWVRSPEFTGDTSFIALSKDNCRILQVRVAGIVSLNKQIRLQLAEDRKLERYFK